MTIGDALAPERVVFLQEDDRDSAFRTLIGKLAEASDMPASEVMERAFFEREALMSTGIGMGIGVPHIRLPGVRRLVMALGIQPQGLADYPAIDHEPVRLLAMIVAGEGQHTEYIRLLAQVVAVLKQSQARTSIIQAASVQSAYHILCSGNEA